MANLDDTVLTLTQGHEDAEPRLFVWYGRLCDSIGDFFGCITSEEYNAVGMKAREGPGRLSLCQGSLRTSYQGIVARYDRFIDTISNFFECITRND